MNDVTRITSEYGCERTTTSCIIKPYLFEFSDSVLYIFTSNSVIRIHIGRRKLPKLAVRVRGELSFVKINENLYDLLRTFIDNFQETPLYVMTNNTFGESWKMLDSHI